MPRRKPAASHENHERWLVSYADFITLLFAFFVVMFATSQTDKNKAKAAEESVRKALEEGQLSAVVQVLFGGAPKDKGKGNAKMQGPRGELKKAPPIPPVGKVVELLPSLNALSKQLELEIKAGKIQVSMEPRGLVISFRQAALFPSGGATMLPEAREPMAKIAAIMNQVPNPVRLEGHTDSMPIHNGQFQSNWELSAARSIDLLRVLTEEFGVLEEKLSIAGYADNSPVESNDTEEGRQRNRRVDIVILNEVGVIAEPQRASPKN